MAVEKIERFSFFERIDNIRFPGTEESGADQYRLWLAQYCGALRSRLTSHGGFDENYKREQNQRALLIGLGMEVHVLPLELSIFQDFIHNKKT